jgi:hypothetical protein
MEIDVDRADGQRACTCGGSVASDPRRHGYDRSPCGGTSPPDVHGLELATLNIEHFPMFADLEAPFRF